MKVETTRFGTLEVQETAIVRVIGGILGFPEPQNYIFLEFEESSPFKWFQCVDDPALAFVVIDARIIVQGYQVVFEPEDIEDLEIDESTDTLDRFILLSVVTIGKDVSQITANLAGPIVINTRNNLAKQLVLPDSGYPVRQRILE